VVVEDFDATNGGRSFPWLPAPEPVFKLSSLKAGQGQLGHYLGAEWLLKFPSLGNRPDKKRRRRAGPIGFGR
jgi:hypothetical protein